MKKQLLFGTMLLGSVFMGAAQETIFSEDFNSETFDFAAEGWVQHKLDGQTNNPAMSDYFPANMVWGILLFGNAPENQFAASTSFFTNAGVAANRWLVTPAIEIPASGAMLTFTDATGDVDAPDGYELYVSTTGTAVADFGMTPIVTRTMNSEDFTERTVDLAAYAGETIHIAWRHNTTNGFLFLLDDVAVTSATAGVNDVFASKFSVYPNPANDVITIANAENMLVNGVKITDLKGRVVKEAKLAGTVEAQISISDLASGMYMVTVSSDKGTATKKIIKN